MDTKELEALDTVHYTPFPIVHDQLLCLAHIEGEGVVLALVSDLLPVGCLIVVGDQACNCCVISRG